MRFSTKELLGIVAFVSVIAWCASRAGFHNPMFWGAVVLSAFLSALVLRFARDEKLRVFAPLSTLPILCCCGLAFGSIMLWVNAAMLLVLGIYCAYRSPPDKRTLTATTMVLFAVACVAGAIPGILEIRTLHALRRQYPIRSVSNRLQHEQALLESQGAAKSRLSPTVAASLVEFETEIDESQLSRRRFQLEHLHNHQYELFVRASGFGIARMPRVRPRLIAAIALQEIPFNGDGATALDSDADLWQSLMRSGTSSSVEHLHTASRNDFLDPVGFGAILQPVTQVVGFVEHAFHDSPLRSLDDPNAWRIDRLELVSLLRFDEPRVYVLDRLPRMDQLSSDDVATRPLDEFETSALSRLQSAEDIAITRSGTDYRMLGSLRAAKQCLECHSVQRGDLLGAFSYTLHHTKIDLQ